MAKDLAALSGSLSAQKFSLGNADMQIDITMLTSMSTAERKQIFMSRYDVDCLLVLRQQKFPTHIAARFRRSRSAIASKYEFRSNAIEASCFNIRRLDFTGCSHIH